MKPSRLLLALTTVLAAAMSIAAAPAMVGLDSPVPPPSVTGQPGVDAPVYADWEWAPFGEAPIHPGTQTVAEVGQCTANFVFVRTETVDDVEYLIDVLLGTAAHCISSASGADECQDTGYPLGTPVTVDGATQPGEAAYNATLSMQAVGETDSDTCNHNDFGLIRLHRDDWERVNPSIPDFGGPVGINTDGLAQGDDVYSWGNSGLRFGVEQTSPKKGVALRTESGGWNHTFYTLSPGIPGDSGSAVLDGDGNALAALSTVAVAPFTASNNADDIGRSLRWALDNEPAMAGLQLVPGTAPWNPGGYPFLP